MSDADLSRRPDEFALSFLAGGGEMGKLIRAFDWSNTGLGPPDGWPQSLKTAIRIMLTSRQPIWIGWGDDLIYLYNDAYQSIIGGKHPWALGKPTSTVWSEIWSEIGPMLATAMGGVEGTYVEEQLLIMERNGYPEETYYTFSYSPIPDDDGAPGGIICANSEDTGRVVGDRQLALLRALAAETVDARSWQEAAQRSITALAADPKDLTFALLYLAAPGDETLRLAAATGVTPGGLLAPDVLPSDGTSPWPASEVLHDEAVRTVEDLEGRFGVTPPTGAWAQPSQGAAVLAIPSTADLGRRGVLVVGLNPMRLFDEAYRSFLGLAAGQITAAIASADAYEEAQRRADALAELDRSKTAFFSNVSHEFRTPLTLMLGPLEDVMGGDLGIDETRARVDLAHRNGVRLLRLVNSLLDFSRIEAGRAQASYRPMDLAAYSAEIASGFRSAFERAGLTLDIQASALPQPVYVDPEMWEKVLLNLLSNAFKYTLSGGATVEICAEGSAAVVRVRDTGIGIPEEHLPRLFERFHRVEGAQGRSFEGSGIGLALVNELVRLHGGEITVASTPGEGATFTVRLPFGHGHLPASQVVDEVARAAPIRTHEYVEEALRWLPDGSANEAEPLASEGGLAALAGAAPQIGRGKHVLLADDNADMRGYVARLLETQGYEVTTVGDGPDALASALAETPDLILSDVMMPRLDGFGLLRALRAEPQTAGVPVILLSARAGEEAKVEGLEAGADDYLIKPFAARELLARVKANIQLAELRRETNRALWETEQRWKISHDRLGLALTFGDVGVFEWDVDADRVAVLGPVSSLYGVDPVAAESGGLPLATFLAGIHVEDRARVEAAIGASIAQAAPFDAAYRVVGSGEERHVVARGQLSRTPEGGARLSGAIVDITAERRAQQGAAERQAALAKQTRALEVLGRAAAAVAGDLDHERVVQSITDAGVKLTGAGFGAFFYNVVDTSGESYMLYTVSGAPRSAFERFPMPRNTAIFHPTFAGEGVVRLADITADPRYGHMAPYYGMPEGHLPVRSYLAVPVRSREGTVLGGLFFGHAEPDRFAIETEEWVASLAHQAAVAMDNARLFKELGLEVEQRRDAEANLNKLNAELERRVVEEVERRSAAEDALRQAQKMEAVGQLTGGVAHDFNNLLTVIIGGLDTVRRSKPEDEVRRNRALDMALQGAQRAAGLTARLLAFSRRQPLMPTPADLNTLVRDMTDLLHRTLGEQIELEGVLAPRLWSVEVDANQLESAILNLAVNARDAMPDGGKLTIETGNTLLDETYTAVDAEVVPGQYVMVAVSDTGSGIPPETISRVFEPFFTTKEVGRGTGLGLSMVYGFVKQSGGHVTIYSEEGQGTTVKLYFPRYLGGVQPDAATAALPIPRSSAGEVVLVVEDNDDVRAYSTMILTELGYTVIEASHAESALAVLRTGQKIDLLFTDVVLPGKSGRVIADEANAMRPGLKVLFTTGYSRNAIVHHGRLDPGVELISKPFTIEQLATRVRDVLDRS